MREEGGSLLPSRIQQGSSQKKERNTHKYSFRIKYINKIEFNRQVNIELWRESENPNRHEEENMGETTLGQLTIVSSADWAAVSVCNF